MNSKNRGLIDSQSAEMSKSCLPWLCYTNKYPNMFSETSPQRFKRPKKPDSKKIIIVKNSEGDLPPYKRYNTEEILEQGNQVLN